MDAEQIKGFKTAFVAMASKKWGMVEAPPGQGNLVVSGGMRWGATRALSGKTVVSGVLSILIGTSQVHLLQLTERSGAVSENEETGKKEALESAIRRMERK
jgi:hypothetical protein